MVSHPRLLRCYSRLYSCQRATRPPRRASVLLLDLWCVPADPSACERADLTPGFRSHVDRALRRDPRVVSRRHGGAHQAHDDERGHHDRVCRRQRRGPAVLEEVLPAPVRRTCLRFVVRDTDGGSDCRNHIPWAILSACWAATAILLLATRMYLSWENARREREERDTTYDEMYVTQELADGTKVEVKVDKEFLDLTDIQNRDFRYVL